jgi:hypothetical protein
LHFHFKKQTEMTSEDRFKVSEYKLLGYSCDKCRHHRMLYYDRGEIYKCILELHYGKTPSKCEKANNICRWFKIDERIQRR